MTTLTTASAAEAIVATFVSQGVTLADEAVAATEIAGTLTAWLGGEDAISADLSLKLSTAIGSWNTNQLQFLDWSAGVVDGGPGSDGLYPLTNAAGVTRLFPCIAKIFAMVGMAGDPAEVVAEITGLVEQAESAKTGAEDARDVISGIVSHTTGRDVLRVLDPTGKAAMRVTRSRKFLVLGRDVFSDIDRALGVSAQVRVATSPRGARMRVIDPSGKVPWKIGWDGRPKVWGRDLLRELDAAKSGAATQAQIDAINALFVPNKNLLIVGDSLSAYSGSWARQVASVLPGPTRTTTILAVGGHTSSQQAGRLGALPFLLTLQDNKILASGATSVTASQMLHPDGVTLFTCWPINNQSTGVTWRARVSGILGTFSSATFTGAVPDDLVFTPDAGQIVTDLPVEVGVPTESVWAAGHEYDTILMGLGRNNFTETDVVKRDWLAVRDWSKTVAKHCIMVTPPNMGGEGLTSGPASYAHFLDLERFAQRHFGECAIISRQILMRHADLGIPGDVTAVADGRVPPSLTSDGVHWVPETGHVYIRDEAARVIIRKGY